MHDGTGALPEDSAWTSLYRELGTSRLRKL